MQHAETAALQSVFTKIDPMAPAGDILGAQY